MSETQKKYVSWSIFIATFSILAAAFGWSVIVSTRAEAKADKAVNSHDSLQAQISLINSSMTGMAIDIEWIKNTLQNKYGIK